MNKTNNSEYKQGKKTKESMSVEDKFNSPFSKRLRELLDNKKISNTEFAYIMNVSPQMVSFWRNGDNIPDIKKVCIMADYFNVSIDYLLGRTDIATTQTDIHTACKVTGLSEKSVIILSAIKNNYKISNDNKLMIPEIRIADYIISSHNFGLFCYNIIRTLNYKKAVDDSIEETKEKMETHIQDEEYRNPHYSKDDDNLVSGYFDDIESDKEWYEFKKWELSKHLELIVNEIVDNYEDFT